jgi:hypothetical protein
MIRLLAHPTPPVTRRQTEKQSQLADGRGGEGGGRGADLYNRKKAWSSINHSIFSVPNHYIFSMTTQETHKTHLATSPCQEYYIPLAGKHSKMTSFAFFEPRTCTYNTHIILYKVQVAVYTSNVLLKRKKIGGSRK